ncbi:hypothetical protein HRbin16_03249 [bacterium HR16]|nr:hypothetical protein HRbin16_03249 [bacterium HR16]
MEGEAPAEPCECPILTSPVDGGGKAPSQRAWAINRLTQRFVLQSTLANDAMKEVY